MTTSNMWDFFQLFCALNALFNLLIQLFILGVFHILKESHN